MPVHEIDLELSSPDYIRNVERVLQGYARSEHPIVQARLHGKPVYLVVDMAAAKYIFENARSFSFAPIGLGDDQGLTEGTKAFVDGGFQSQLVTASYDGYREIRKVLNNAFKCAYTDRMAEVDELAKRHIAELVAGIRPGRLDALALCRGYWLPLVADIIGVAGLSVPELTHLAKWARTLNEGYGHHGDRENIDVLATAKAEVTGMIRRVVSAQTAPPHSALGYFLSVMDTEAAIDLARTFILGSINTDSGVLGLQTHLLAAHAGQRARFLAMSEVERQNAMTEIAAKEQPVYYMPRFAVHDISVQGVEIPAGSCVHLAIHAINSCANPDFNIDRGAGIGPANETIPFGHARHKCPGETLARHLIPIFLAGLFGHFRHVEVLAFEKDVYAFTRSINQLVLNVLH